MNKSGKLSVNSNSDEMVRVCVCACVRACRWPSNEARNWANWKRRQNGWSWRPRHTLRRRISSRWSTRTRNGTSFKARAHIRIRLAEGADAAAILETHQKHVHGALWLGDMMRDWRDRDTPTCRSRGVSSITWPPVWIFVEYIEY